MTPRVLLPLLLLCAFCLATRLGSWQEASASSDMRSGNVLAMLMGDSRRMFANHFFTKADAYFHSGYYPSIFDNREAYKTRHVSGDAGAEQDDNAGEDHTFMVKPPDWIDRFNRKFSPSEHTHLDQLGAPGSVMVSGSPDGCAACAAAAKHVHDETCNHEIHDELEGAEHGDHEDHGNHEDPAHDNAAETPSSSASPGLEREMLPWLRFTVSLDPHRVEGYLVAAFWLRERLGRTEEAEAFLREGLMQNPNSCELTFELGRIALETRKDTAAARQLWSSGLVRWDRTEREKEEPDYFMRRQLLAYLALAEEQDQNFTAALAHLQEADALPGGKGLYTERIVRLQQEANVPAASVSE